MQILHYVCAIHDNHPNVLYYLKFNYSNKTFELAPGKKDVFYFDDPAVANQMAKNYRPMVSGLVGVKLPGVKMFVADVQTKEVRRSLVW